MKNISHPTVKRDFDRDGWSAQIVARVAAYSHFSGFQGDYCWKCGKTTNILTGIAGWICDHCGHYTVCAIHGGQRCHKIPDFGPSKENIRAGYELAMILRIVCSMRTEPYWFERYLGAV